MKAERLLDSSCEGYLVSVVNIVENNLPILAKCQCIVQEYPKLFLNDVPGLPPDREIEFVIDLSQGTTPISKASYQMDLAG